MTRYTLLSAAFALTMLGMVAVPLIGCLPGIVGIVALMFIYR